MKYRLPEEWNDWTITEKIGEGSFGMVYKAVRRSGETEEVRAIKIINFLQEEEELKQDTLKEIRLMASLKGTTNIVQLEDYFVEETSDRSCRIYIRMEYLQDFQTRYAWQDMSEREIVKLALDVCEALINCEERGILHRDIKPGNILYSPEEDAYKLSDFGSSREEEFPEDYSVKGTYSYMAPEVFKSQSYDKNADIYSLGITLYRLLNRNRFPFENVYRKEITFCERENALMRRINGERLPEPINADEMFAEVILKACAFNPEERYKSAWEMKKDLLKLVDLQEVCYA